MMMTTSMGVRMGVSMEFYIVIVIAVVLSITIHVVAIIPLVFIVEGLSSEPQHRLRHELVLDRLSNLEEAGRAESYENECSDSQ